MHRHRPARTRVAIAGLALVASALLAATALAVPRTFEVRLPDGTLTTATVDAPPGVPIEEVEGLPGEPVREVEPPEEDAGPRAGGGDASGSGPGRRGHRRRHPPSTRGGSRQPPRPHPRRPHARHRSHRHPRPHRHRRARRHRPPFELLPSPGRPVTAIGHWRVPLFLLPVYQAAGLRYGVPWEVLAAINEVESNYGQNPSESSAGAVGWMQFMPATWRQYGVDANSDGVRDPADPVDAIFASARYLQASGAATDLRGAVFAYNHADWYVDTILLRARLIRSYPARLVGGLTGLASARFPIAARARYAVGARAATIYSSRRAPVVAVADGVVRSIGRSPSRGRYVDLEDAYGNRYGYSHLGKLAHLYPVPRRIGYADGFGGLADSLTAAALALSTRPGAPPPIVKQRLFAHPGRKNSKAAGGFEQLLMSQGYSVFDGGVAGTLSLDPRYVELRPLRRGSHVLASTVLGRVTSTGRPTMRFAIRPPGADSEPLDPRPVIEAWGALARERFAPDRSAAVLLLPRDQLEARVLADPRVSIYPCGRHDIRTHRIDRRVLATLEYLAESGLDPQVSALECGHGYYTASGNVSEHSAGAAVDISAIGGVPIFGHQQPGGIAEQTVRRLMLLQGDVRPHQIISLLPFGANTMALGDHDDHVHVGFHPAAGGDAQAAPPAEVARREWALLGRGLAAMPRPVVPQRPSRWSLSP